MMARDLAERLDTASGVAAVWQAGVSALAEMGVAGVIWVDAAGSGPPRLRSTLGAEWEAGNRVALATGVDPFPRHCLSRMSSLRTGAAHLGRYRYLPPRQCRFIHEAADRTGFSAGVSMPVRAAPGGQGQGWNLMAEGGAGELDTLLRERGTLLAYAAHLIHARLIEAETASPGAVSGTSRKRNMRLTPRERDCLAFVADGLRTIELAHRLGITEGTVEFHLANARRKLGARTRDHAVALAIRRGMLDG